MTTPPKPSNTFSERFVEPMMESFGLSRNSAITALVFITLLLAGAIYYFIHSAPPKVIYISSGQPGSMFERYALSYSNSFYSNHVGVTLKILPSNGSEENLARLADPKSEVTVGFVQGGITNATKSREFVSLGSLAYVPVFVFYRGDVELTNLSAFTGKRIAVGLAGSGTHKLATDLLVTNGVTSSNSTPLNMDADDAGDALTAGTIDAAFLMGDSASSKLLRKLLVSKEIHVMDFPQADAYTRIFPSLNELKLPMGAFDLGRNLPPHDLHLIGPTVELVACSDIHPALCDLLVETAQEIHGPPALLRRKGEFPNPIEHDFPISPDALRFYKTGKGFLYRSLPFWVASLINRILVAFIPVVLLLIPGLKAIPAFFKWRLRNQLYRRYGMLLALERDLGRSATPESLTQLHERIKEIETSVNTLKLPSSFADQFYALRQHFEYVRSRLAEASKSTGK